MYKESLTKIIKSVSVIQIEKYCRCHFGSKFYKAKFLYKIIVDSYIVIILKDNQLAIARVVKYPLIKMFQTNSLVVSEIYFMI